MIRIRATGDNELLFPGSIYVIEKGVAAVLDERARNYEGVAFYWNLAITAMKNIQKQYRGTAGIGRVRVDQYATGGNIVEVM